MDGRSHRGVDHYNSTSGEEGLNTSAGSSATVLMPSVDQHSDSCSEANKIDSSVASSKTKAPNPREPKKRGPLYKLGQAPTITPIKTTLDSTIDRWLQGQCNFSSQLLDFDDTAVPMTLQQKLEFINNTLQHKHSTLLKQVMMKLRNSNRPPSPKSGPPAGTTQANSPKFHGRPQSSPTAPGASNRIWSGGGVGTMKTAAGSTTKALPSHMLPSCATPKANVTAKYNAEAVDKIRRYMLNAGISKKHTSWDTSNWDGDHRKLKPVMDEDEESEESEEITADYEPLPPDEKMEEIYSRAIAELEKLKRNVIVAQRRAKSPPKAGATSPKRTPRSKTPPKISDHFKAAEVKPAYSSYTYYGPGFFRVCSYDIPPNEKECPVTVEGHRERELVDHLTKLAASIHMLNEGLGASSPNHDTPSSPLFPLTAQAAARAAGYGSEEEDDELHSTSNSNLKKYNPNTNRRPHTTSGKRLTRKSGTGGNLPLAILQHQLRSQKSADTQLPTNGEVVGTPKAGGGSFMTELSGSFAVPTDKLPPVTETDKEDDNSTTEHCDEQSDNDSSSFTEFCLPAPPAPSKSNRPTSAGSSSSAVASEQLRQTDDEMSVAFSRPGTAESTRSKSLPLGLEQETPDDNNKADVEREEATAADQHKDSPPPKQPQEEVSQWKQDASVVGPPADHTPPPTVLPRRKRSRMQRRVTTEIAERLSNTKDVNGNKYTLSKYPQPTLTGKQQMTHYLKAIQRPKYTLPGHRKFVPNALFMAS